MTGPRKDWAVFYAPGFGDGYGTLDGFGVVEGRDVGYDPSIVPAVGVLAVTRSDENGYRLRHGTPYYTWRAEYGEFFETNADAMYRYLERPGWKRVLFGEYIDDPTFERLLAIAARKYPGQKNWRGIERPEEGR